MWVSLYNSNTRTSRGRWLEPTRLVFENFTTQGFPFSVESLSDQCQGECLLNDWSRNCYNLKNLCHERGNMNSLLYLITKVCFLTDTNHASSCLPTSRLLINTFHPHSLRRRLFWISINLQIWGSSQKIYLDNLSFYQAWKLIKGVMIPKFITLSKTLWSLSIYRFWFVSCCLIFNSI